MEDGQCRGRYLKKLARFMTNVCVLHISCEKRVYRIASNKILIANNRFLLAFICFYCKRAGNASVQIMF